MAQYNYFCKYCGAGIHTKNCICTACGEKIKLIRIIKRMQPPEVKK